jgi:hypothetical protein
MSVYQIAIFANGADIYAATLRTTIQRKYLGPRHTLRNAFFSRRCGRHCSRPQVSHTVGVFFGLTPHPAPATSALSDLINDAALVVPIVPACCF